MSGVEKERENISIWKQSKEVKSSDFLFSVFLHPKENFPRALTVWVFQLFLPAFDNEPRHSHRKLDDKM